ncbi:G1 family glutamic endopeptidase [Gordoniibacillus kamchatkensis]|uniref:G1 family glutamic endopeptidase n=1 Tax=Gordoniibacillus kamchatkensis TaxID=1590651 RepID=UPI0009E4B97A|nr:G1 family glutamic endopeptidase [Paenibacillus sp. VKM B-2647]
MAQARSQSAGRIRRAPRIADKFNLKKAHSAGFGWSSSNWSGYAITKRKGAISSVAGRWIVPRVGAAGRTSYSSAWIGIDGFTNHSLVQTGTEHDFVNGTARYYAWWEILPAAETRIRLPVSPGDRMSAAIRSLGSGKWSIRLTNETRKWTFRTIRSYAGPRTSAEWIVEAPSINGRTAVLANYGRIAFRQCRVNGKSPDLQRSNGGVMNRGSVRKSTPSAPNSRGDGFNVAYGGATPPAPAAARKRNTKAALNAAKPLRHAGSRRARS